MEDKPVGHATRDIKAGETITIVVGGNDDLPVCEAIIFTTNPFRAKAGSTIPTTVNSAGNFEVLLQGPSFIEKKLQQVKDQSMRYPSITTVEWSLFENFLRIALEEAVNNGQEYNQKYWLKEYEIMENRGRLAERKEIEEMIEEMSLSYGSFTVSFPSPLKENLLTAIRNKK